jgi:DNA-binding transcriptional LysR family regulator
MTEERLDYEFLFEDSYSIVVGAKNPLARRRSIALADLVDESWGLAPTRQHARIGRGGTFEVKVSFLLFRCNAQK